MASAESAARMVDIDPPANADPTRVPGYADFRDLQVAIGIPATRIVLGGLIAASGLDPARKKGLRRRVAKIHLIGETGCLTATVLDVKTREPHTYHYVIDKVAPGYDMAVELEKVDRHVAEKGRADNREAVAQVIMLGQYVYGGLAKTEEGQKIIRELRSALALGEDDLSTLDVCLETSQMHPKGYPSVRAGVHVKI